MARSKSAHLKRFRKYLSRTAIALLLTYLGSYTLLSVTGCYRITLQGLQYEHYAWIPYGYFDRANNLRRGIYKLYLPLFVLDNRFWHTDKNNRSPSPPFEQGEIRIVPPVKSISFEPTKSECKETIKDADGQQFCIIFKRENHLRTILVFPTDDPSKQITVYNLAKFKARITDFMEYDERENNK